jgi:CHASE3 domain sensor protein
MPIETFRPTKVRIAFGMALAVLSVAGILLSRDISRLSETVQRAWEARDVVSRLDDIFNAFRDSVSASRGSAPDAARLHQQSVETIHAALRDIRQSTIQKPDQRQRLSSLEAALDQVIALERRRLEMVQIKGSNAGDALFLEGGRELDDRIRRIIADIKSAENLFSRRLQAERDRRIRTLENVFISSITLGVVILLAVYYYLEREIGRRQRSESRLIHLNRLYAFLSRANQTIVRARTREELFRDVCRVAVEHGQFLSAWIGTLEPESGRIKSLHGGFAKKDMCGRCKPR